MSLRIRLLLSYLFLLIAALGVSAGALLLLISNRAAPPEPTYERLAALVQGLNLRDLIDELNLDANRPLLQIEIPELLDTFAESRNVRALQVRLTPHGSTVIYDSANVYQTEDEIQLFRDTYFDNRLQQVLMRGVEQIFGGFTDLDGTDWLYGGIIINPRIGQNIMSDARNIWILAEPRSTISLQETLADFSAALLPPLIQAGIAGILIAIVLAALISRTIAKPLQQVATGATAVAKGDFGQHVPVSGPPEVRAVAESFNYMTAEVRATHAAQRDFLANVSHDLKTPLTSIQGYSQAIIDGAAKDPKNAAQIIYEEAGRLNRMVVELTDLVRLQAGRLSMKTAPIDMGELAAAVVQKLSVVAHKQGITLTADSQPMPHIAGDGDRLAQVLTNLISNALKFTPTGGRVDVITRLTDDGVVLIVRDTGIGISQKDLSRVFERFFQVDKARGPKRGTGLGLAITREIIEAHGGQISVHSEGQNQGTTFRIWLPSPHLSTVVRKSVQ